MAARNGQLEFVKNLITKKVKINLRDNLKYNALSYSIHGPMPMNTKKAMCQLLVENGADAFSEDHLQLSPILIMIEFGFIDCIRAVKFSTIAPCDQQDRLTEIKSLTLYAEKEEELEIRDYIKSMGCH